MVYRRALNLARSWSDDLSAGLPADRIRRGYTSPMTVREPTSREASGRRTLIRAAVTIVIGGVVIAVVSAAFGSRLFAADARILGLFTGMTIAALGLVAPIGPTSRKMVIGVLVIVLSLISFPIALGGYVFGSLTAIVGGAMLVGYVPPIPPVRVETQAASYVRRLVALLIDFAVAFVFQRVLYLLAPPFFTNTFNVVVSWILVWLAVAVEPTILTRRTPGRLLLSLRVADWRTGRRSSTTGAAVRELMRGFVAIGTLFAVWAATLRETLNEGRGLMMLLVACGLVALAEAAELMGRVTGTISAHDVLVQGGALVDGPITEAAHPDRETAGTPRDSVRPPNVAVTMTKAAIDTSTNTATRKPASKVRAGER